VHLCIAVARLFDSPERLAETSCKGAALPLPDGGQVVGQAGRIQLSGIISVIGLHQLRDVGCCEVLAADDVMQFEQEGLVLPVVRVLPVMEAVQVAEESRDSREVEDPADKVGPFLE